MDSIANARRRADLGAPLLSLFAPGLGQLYQRRYKPAAHFLVHSAVLMWVFIAAPSLRASAWPLLLAIAAWSVLDAVQAGRVASRELLAAR